MDTPYDYFSGTEVATRGLFEILRKYRNDQNSAYVEVFSAKDCEDLNSSKEKLEAIITAKNVIAGSILHIAYAAIDAYSICAEKPESVKFLEHELKTLLADNECTAREVRGKKLQEVCFRKKFCVGRKIGDFPIGLIIFAGRNQYNHFKEERLSPENELIFNYLDATCAPQPNDTSFNIYEGRPLHSYSILQVLKWIDIGTEDAFDRYQRDMFECFL